MMANVFEVENLKEMYFSTFATVSAACGTSST